MLLRDLRSQLLQPLDVQIDWAGANGATTWQRNTGTLHTGDQRPQHQCRSAHSLYQLVRRFGIHQVATADGGAVLGTSVAQFDFGAHGRQQLALRLDITDLRNVFEYDWLF